MRRRLELPSIAMRVPHHPARDPEPSATLLRLQKACGNRAVTRLLLQRQPKHEKLLEELDRDLAKGKRDKAIATLRGLGKDELTAVDAARGSLEEGRAALLHRCISFVKWGARDETPHADDVTVSKAGTGQGKPMKVPGGTVEVRMDADYRWKKGSEEKTGGVSLDYSGSDAARTRWLQFIWRGIWVERKPRGKGGKPPAKPVEGTITRGNGTYKLTADRSKPDWNTDASAGTPYFEANGSVNRGGKEVTLYDAPDPRDDLARTEFDDAADPPTKGTSIAHLTDYLVRDMDVLLRIDIEIEWDLLPSAAKGDNPGVSKPRFAKPTITRVAALDPEHRKRVVSQYPTLDLEWLP